MHKVGTFVVLARFWQAFPESRGILSTHLHLLASVQGSAEPIGARRVVHKSQGVPSWHQYIA